MEINKIFELSRKFQNKNQEEIAHEVNIDRSAIAHFEAGRYKLSINMMGKIARVLNISKAYIDGETQNPFMSEDIIRFYLRGKNLQMDLQPLIFLFSLGYVINITLLIPPPAVSLKRIRTKKPVHSIIIIDADDNLFLLTSKKKNTYIADADILENTIKNYSKKYPTQPPITIKTIPVKLLKKINKSEIDENILDDLFRLVGILSIDLKDTPLDLKMLKELNALGKFEKPERDRILLTALKKYLDSPEGIELLEKYKKGKQK